MTFLLFLINGEVLGLTSAQNAVIRYSAFGYLCIAVLYNVVYPLITSRH